MLVMTDVDTLRDGLHDRSIHQDSWGTPLDPATLRMLACEADIIPVVLDGAGVPLDMGRRRRLPTPSQRLAVTARDQHCVIPGCGMPPEWCQVHHIVEWIDGGPTDLDNLALVCHGHHREIHHGHLIVRGTANELRVLRPDGTELLPRRSGGEATREPRPPP
jgi:hypothetical protein